MIVNKVKRIVWHWTAGKGYPNAVEVERYHYLIDCEGNVYEGNHSVEDNFNCYDGNYAKHTGGGNTGAIGIAFCGMMGYKDRKNVGDYPITRKQFEAGMLLCAELCKEHNLKITPDTVTTHYEFGENHPKTSSYGKIDITYLPPFPFLNKDFIAKFIRAKVRWYLIKKVK